MPGFLNRTRLELKQNSGTKTGNFVVVLNRTRLELKRRHICFDLLREKFLIAPDWN